MIQNGGINGYWTHYILMHPTHGRVTGKNNRGEIFSNLEKNLLDGFPTTLATQQRFEIFLQQNQASVKNHAKLACIPCGMMGELLYLDYTNVTGFELTGFDLDITTMEQMKKLLENIGFKNIRIFPDNANIFPTIVANK